MFGGEFFRANMFAGSPHLSDEHILARVDALDATLARRVDRLQYLRRLLLHAFEALLAALQAEQDTVGSWQSQILLICFRFGRLFLAWPIYLALFCNSPTGPIIFFCMTNGLGLLGGLPTCIGDLLATKLRRVLGFAGFICKLECIGLWRHSIPQAVLQETFCCPQSVEVFVVSANGRTSGSSAWLP